MNIEEIQDYLRAQNLDGWLMADFHGYNSVFVETLQITAMLTRRAFLFIPADGEVTVLCHAIEKSRFESIEGNVISYSGYRQLETKLRELISPLGKIAMEYSPKGRLPYVAKVDAGTVELVREMGPEILSSADLVAYFQARLDVEQMASHRMAARNLLEIKDKVFSLISERLENGAAVHEHEISRFMLNQFEQLDMETDHSPNCSFGAHAGDPHYDLTPESNAALEKGDIVLIDLWAKLKTDHAVFGDITWMAYAGTKEEIPNRYAELFAVIAAGRDSVVEFLRENIEKRPVFGFEVDDICRDVIVKAGHGDAFTHRTGHSIASSVHGSGPNIDNLETEDRRQLQKGHLFSIEPGLYYDDFGLRTEIDCLISHEGVEINPLPVQKEIWPLMDKGG